MIRVGILGASGYTAREATRILLRHPDMELRMLCSRREQRPAIAELFPELTSRIDLHCEPFDPDRLADRCDCVLSALPHTASMAAVPAMLDRGLRVVDLSADYRLTDPAVYAQWYDADHTDISNLGQAVYGMPELFARKIAQARLVANPGCYPTAAILPLAPLVAGRQVELDGIIVDAKSGVSGAGRTPKLTSHFPECNESVCAYSAGRHRHTPEIDQVLSGLSGGRVEVVFVPHLIPMDQGILATIYARPTGKPDPDALHELLADYYHDCPFVRVVPHLPATKFVRDTNFCDVAVRVVRGWIVLVCAIDNLVKGASGAAVQNLNVMYGLDQTAGLL